MGQPKFARRKYDTPTHPWKADRILEETALQRRFGLKNKREVWKGKSRLRRIRSQARHLLARLRTGEEQAKMEQKRLLRRLNNLGVLGANATLDDVLALGIEQLLTRRLQTQVYLKGLAATPTQARQFIAHGHVTVGGIRVNVPGHLVTRPEEETIQFDASSAVADEGHPVRPKLVEAGQAALRKMKEPLQREPEGRGRGPPRRGGPPGRGGPGGPRRGGPPGARPARPAGGGGAS